MKDNRLIGILVLVAIVVAIFYFLPMLKGPECNFDSDCQEGYVCSMDGNCILPEIVNERTRDNFCADNTYPKGNYDPDCPKYCPAEFERKGGITMCCLNDELTISIDCETGIPLNLFPEVTFGIPEQRPAQEWYDMVSGLQAMVSFVPKGENKQFEYHDQPVTMSVSVTTGKPAEGSNGYRIWLSNVETKSKTTTYIEPIFTSAWNNCQVENGNPCIGKNGAFDLGGEATVPSVWSIDAHPSNINPDDYSFKLSYCGIALPESLGIPEQCPAPLEYDLTIGESVLSFSVSVGI